MVKKYELSLQENSYPAVPGMERAVAYIEANIHRPVTLKEVADHMYLNPNYFSALFRDRMGINYSDYVTQKRLAIAKDKLLKTNDSIAEISENVGYQTAKYFTHLFKKYEGITPSSYRKTNRDSA